MSMMLLLFFNFGVVACMAFLLWLGLQFGCYFPHVLLMFRSFSFESTPAVMVIVAFLCYCFCLFCRTGCCCQCCLWLVFVCNTVLGNSLFLWWLIYCCSSSSQVGHGCISCCFDHYFLNVQMLFWSLLLFWCYCFCLFCRTGCCCQCCLWFMSLL